MPEAIEKPGLIFRADELDLDNMPGTDSHLHTSWTDGAATVQQVYRAAVERGLATVLYSEHSRETSVDWFHSFAAEVRSLPSSPCRAYVGTEVRVKSREGEIDSTTAITDLCDFVVASVHRFVDARGRAMEFELTSPGDAIELEFELAWEVLANPRVDILGHIFGMSYRRFNVTPPEEKMRALVSRAADLEVAVEINSRYHPDPLRLLHLCRDCNARVTFGSDAHALEDVGEVMRVLGQLTGHV